MGAVNRGALSFKFSRLKMIVTLEERGGTPLSRASRTTVNDLLVSKSSSREFWIQGESDSTVK